MPNQLVVIDRKVANYQSLIDQLGTAYSYLLLDSNSDGVTQIANYVAANPGFDAIHLISHGSPGQVAIGTSTLSEATLGEYSAQLNQIGASLNAGGDLLIYGCDVAQGGIGQQLITDLARLTRLDVAASTNRTGGTGDWVLEAATGPTRQALPALVDEPSLAISDPTVIWTRSISANSFVRALTTGSDGSIYSAGHFIRANGGGSVGGFLIKSNPDGTNVWTNLIGPPGDTTYANALATGLDGSIYVAGYTTIASFDGQTNAGGNDAFITKFAPDGTKVWTRLTGSTSSDTACALAIGLDGSVYMAGTTGNPSIFTTLDGQNNFTRINAFVTKYGADGTKQWTQLIVPDGEVTAQAYALCRDSDGSIYLAGSFYGTNKILNGQRNSGYDDAFVTKFAPNGTKIWTTAIGGRGFESAQAITVGSDGFVYVAGYAGPVFNEAASFQGQAIAGEKDAFITKLTAVDGQKVWTSLVGAAKNDYANALTIGPGGAIYRKRTGNTPPATGLLVDSCPLNVGGHVCT
jgi:hypothetical protein